MIDPLMLFTANVAAKLLPCTEECFCKQISPATYPEPEFIILAFVNDPETVLIRK
jgi:hypothetical protein